MKKHFFFLNLNTTIQVPMYIMRVLLLLPISYQIPVYNDEPHITLYIYFVQVYQDIGLFNNTVYIHSIKWNVHIYKHNEKVQ